MTTALPYNQKTIETFHDQNGLGMGPFGDNLLLLTCVGFKTGIEITTPVVYRRRDRNFVVIGSNGGAPHDPNWVRNLQTQPEVDVEVAAPGGTEHFKVRARVVAGSPEHDELYAYLTEVWPAFADYQQKTERVIPVVVLEPID